MSEPIGVTRRQALGLAGAGVVATGVGGAYAATRDDGKAAAAAYPFHGGHQAGIVTPAQDRLYFAAFDVTATSRSELVALLQRWTAAAEQLTRGVEVGPGGAPLPLNAPAQDTGETIGLPSSGLTITFGFGPSLFRDSQGNDRFGLAARRPALLQSLPPFPADNLDPRRSGGDLCVQACANDPQVAVHAVRNLSKLAFGAAALRWAQLGFGRTSSTSTAQQTPRNLFGFKDGTANLKAENLSDIEQHVWVAPGDDANADWLTGGSYLVARRIRMFIEPWDRTPLGEQQTLIGRDRPEGAPLSGGTEFTEPDFEKTGPDGEPLMDPLSHVKLAHPSQNNGVRMLRRGYNFADGNDDLGRLDAGLFFVAFVRDPARQYIPMQNNLSKNDGLMEYLQHTGSGIFAVPAGVQPGQYVGQGLFES
jgi:deferrochelatase/peroxidase EfeB